MAGEDLSFEVKIDNIREATPQEREHGHVHSHGHDH
jgi:FKBP-type peptidyl-prolyl cis-trans isomerase SlyD